MSRNAGSSKRAQALVNAATGPDKKRGSKTPEGSAQKALLQSMCHKPEEPPGRSEWDFPDDDQIDAENRAPASEERASKRPCVKPTPLSGMFKEEPLCIRPEQLLVRKESTLPSLTDLPTRRPPSATPTHCITPSRLKCSSTPVASGVNTFTRQRPQPVRQESEEPPQTVPQLPAAEESPAAAPAAATEPELTPEELRRHAPGEQKRKWLAQTAPPGMANQGNTCYMNAVLQMLFSFPSFCKHLKALEATWPGPGPSILPATPSVTTADQPRDAATTADPAAHITPSQLSRPEQQPTAHTAPLPGKHAASGGPVDPKAVGAALPAERITRAMTALLEKIETASKHNLSRGERMESVQPTLVRQAMRGAQWRTRQQQDAHEYYVALLDQLMAEVLTSQTQVTGRRGSSRQLSLSPAPQLARPPGSILTPATTATAGAGTSAASTLTAVQAPPHAISDSAQVTGDTSPAAGTHTAEEAAPAALSATTATSPPALATGEPAEQQAEGSTQPGGRAGQQPPHQQPPQPPCQLEAPQGEAEEEEHLRVCYSDALCPGVRTLNGCLLNTFRCHECGHVSHVREQFSHLSLQLPQDTLEQAPSLLQLLHEHLKDEEITKACDECKLTHAAHTVRHEFLRLPEVLALHLKRFSYKKNPLTGQYRSVKLHTNIDLPADLEVLDIGDMCVSDVRAHPSLVAHLADSIQQLGGHDRVVSHTQPRTQQPVQVTPRVHAGSNSPDSNKENCDGSPPARVDRRHGPGVSGAATTGLAQGSALQRLSAALQSFPKSSQELAGSQWALDPAVAAAQRGSGCSGDSLLAGAPLRDSGNTTSSLPGSFSFPTRNGSQGSPMGACLVLSPVAAVGCDGVAGQVAAGGKLLGGSRDCGSENGSDVGEDELVEDEEGEADEGEGNQEEEHQAHVRQVPTASKANPSHGGLCPGDKRRSLLAGVQGQVRVHAASGFNRAAALEKRFGRRAGKSPGQHGDVQQREARVGGRAWPRITGPTRQEVSPRRRDPRKSKMGAVRSKVTSVDHITLDHSDDTLDQQHLGAGEAGDDEGAAYDAGLQGAVDGYAGGQQAMEVDDENDAELQRALQMSLMEAQQREQQLGSQPLNEQPQAEQDAEASYAADEYERRQLAEAMAASLREYEAAGGGGAPSGAGQEAAQIVPSVGAAKAKQEAELPNLTEELEQQTDSFLMARDRSFNAVFSRFAMDDLHPGRPDSPPLYHTPEQPQGQGGVGPGGMEGVEQPGTWGSDDGPHTPPTVGAGRGSDGGFLMEAVESPSKRRRGTLEYETGSPVLITGEIDGRTGEAPEVIHLDMPDHEDEELQKAIALSVQDLGEHAEAEEEAVKKAMKKSLEEYGPAGRDEYEQQIMDTDLPDDAANNSAGAEADAAGDASAGADGGSRPVSPAPLTLLQDEPEHHKVLVCEDDEGPTVQARTPTPTASTTLTALGNPAALARADNKPPGQRLSMRLVAASSLMPKGGSPHKAKKPPLAVSTPVVAAPPAPPLLRDVAKYRLHGAVCHQGNTPVSGHYVAYAMLPAVPPPPAPPLPVSNTDNPSPAEFIFAAAEPGAATAGCVEGSAGSDEAVALASCGGSGTAPTQETAGWQWWKYDDNDVTPVSGDDAREGISAKGYIIFISASAE